jgi:FtsZ-binding cell division protein ZapB
MTEEELQLEIERLASLADSLGEDCTNALKRIEKAEAENAQIRQDAAMILHALDAALQWGEALFMFLPQGTVLPEGVKTAKGALDEAMTALRTGRPPRTKIR